jgi:hypothetical protein
MSSTGAGPRIPYTGTNVINAGEFDRGPLTAGHEAPSPSSTANDFPYPGNHSAADQIAAMSRDHAMVSLTNLHDHIAAAAPDLCPLGMPGTGAPVVAGFSGAGASSLGTAGSLRPVKATSATAEVVKTVSTEEAGDDTLVAEVANGQEVLIDTEVLTSLVKTILTEELATRFDEVFKTLNAVKADVDELASMPDPTQAPVRGSVVVERASVTKSVSPADELRDQAALGLQEEINYLKKSAQSGNPELRMRAEQELKKRLDWAANAGIIIE